MFLDKKMECVTPHTTTNRETLKLQLDEIRRLRVAFCREEMAAGVNTLGIPIFDLENKAVASVVIAGPGSSIRCDQESPIAIVLKATVRDISGQLFHLESMAEIQNENKGINL
jgi:DNA-binding IclR family transcriptional regulator